MSTTEKEHRSWLRSHGLCAGCKEPIAVNSTWYCSDCLERQASWHRNWYANLTPEAKAEVMQKRYDYIARKKAAGICIGCKRPAREGKVFCALCADKKNKRERERRRRLKYEKD